MKPAGFRGIFIPEDLFRQWPANPFCKPLARETNVQNIPHGPVHPASFAAYISLELMSIALRTSSALIGAVLAAGFFWGYAGLADVGSAGNRMDPGRSEAMIAGPLYLLLLLTIIWVCRNSEDPVTAAYGIEAQNIFKKTCIALLLCVPAAFFFVGFVAPPFIIATSAVYLLMSALSVKSSNER